MKYYLLLLSVVLLSSAQLLAITIETAHFGYSPGSLRNYRQGNWTSGATDLTEGSGKSWSFSLPVTGYVHNSYSSVNGVPGFAAANISCYYDQSVNGYGSSGYMYYQNTGTDILSLGYTGAPNVVWSPPIPTGLPHYLGKIWQGTHSYTYGSYSVAGKVISEGTVTTHLGTFAAVCVRYLYSTTSLSYYCYQWETIPYGVIAYSLTLNNGMLYVLEEANPYVANQDNLYEPLFPLLSLSPNPAHNQLQLSFSLPQPEDVRLSIFNLRGQLLWRQDYSGLRAGSQRLEIALSETRLSNGVYLLRFDSGSQHETMRFILRN